MSGCLIFDETLAIECAAFTKDGKKFVYGTKAYGMCVVDMDTWEECAKFLAKTPITCISISPDGKTIACGSNVGRVYMCSLEDKRAYQLDYHDPDYEVTDIAFHPSGNILVSGSADGVIVVWDVKTGRGDEPIIPMPSTSSIVSIKFESADVMWVARRDGVTISYNTSNWKKITKVEFGDELVNMFVHNNEELSPVLIAATSQKLMKSSTGGGGVVEIDLSTKLETSDSIHNIGNSSSKNIVALTTESGSCIYLLDMDLEEWFSTIDDLVEDADSMTISPDGKFIAACSNNGVRVYNLAASDKHRDKRQKLIDSSNQKQ